MYFCCLLPKARIIMELRIWEFLQEFPSVIEIIPETKDSDFLGLETCILEKWLKYLSWLYSWLVSGKIQALEQLKSWLHMKMHGKTELKILSLHFQIRWWDGFSYALTLNSDNFSMATWSCMWVEHLYNVAKFSFLPQFTTNGGISTHYC